MKWDWADGQICWSWCGTTPRFVARKDREGKGGWIKKRQGLGSLSFVLKFLRLPSPGRSHLLRGNNKGSGLVSSMAVMAAPLDDTKLSPVSRVGSTLSQVYAGYALQLSFPSFQLSLGSANLEGFCISISTYSYNPLLLRSWRMNARTDPRDLLGAIRRWWRRRWWRTKLFEGLWASLSTLRGIRYHVFRYDWFR